MKLGKSAWVENNKNNKCEGKIVFFSLPSNTHNADAERVYQTEPIFHPQKKQCLF
jgi:hypothetical protein